MNGLPTLRPLFRMATCGVLAISASTAFAQDRIQQVSPATTAPGMVSSFDGYKSVPPGYMPDQNFYWAPSGRPPQVLRPMAPGYTMSPSGAIEYTPAPGQYAPYSRSYGRVSQWMALRCQEKQSFHRYIRGEGPAIHSRPASIFW